MLQVTADEDDEEDLLIRSLPSIVYGLQRGEHRFVQGIPHSSYSSEEQESLLSSSLAREPLPFEDDLDI